MMIYHVNLHAMLDSFRSLAGSLPAKILLLFLVLSFGVWGVGDMVRSQGRNSAIATVGGTSISANEFARALHRESENMRNMLGSRYSPDLIKSLNLPQQVLQKLISRILIAKESESLGLVPSDAEIVKHIRSNSAFQDSKGNFDKALFDAMLKNLGTTEKTYVQQMREDMASSLLLDTLRSAAPVSDMAVHTLYDLQEEQRAAAVYTIMPSLVANVPSPTDAQLQVYYDTHKNEFTAPEYRTVSYTIISPTDVQPTASADELKAAYKDRIDEFKHPERRTVEQLLYASEDKAKAAEEMLKAGKSFADVAKQTEITNKSAISLGKVERHAIPPDAADAVFSLPAGGHTNPIPSPFGWHIFGVTAIEPPSVSPFDEVRPQLEKDLKARNASEGLSKLANKLEDTLAGGATLKEAAQELKLKMVNLSAMDRQGVSPDGNKLKDIPTLDKFLDTAFKTDDKSESSLITSKGDMYYVVRVDNVTPEHVRPLEEVKGLVIASWQKEERLKELAQLAKDIASAFPDPAKRGEVMAKYDLRPVTDIIKRGGPEAQKLGLPPALVDDIFRHKMQESTGAYNQSNGNYMIAVVSNIIPAQSPDKDPKLKEALTDIRSELLETSQNEILEQYARYLADKYGVSINEAALEAVTK
jgi:peptidyl-prolyl cis-trans isomerase D